jgi:ribosomal protein S18 acetylase RimI-like enzyme
MERTQVLDHIFWHALVGPHAKYATGAGGARRYARGFSPILGFADVNNPDFASIAPFCEPGEQFYCDGWTGKAPNGWQIVAEATMFRMVWDAPPPEADTAPDAVELRTDHAPQALELAMLCKPGPFGLRTVELGDYFGYFEGERLVAMAGERMCAPGFHEISGVCTHPEFQGRGYARKLMTKLIRLQLQRNEIPFLNVMRANETAHRLYLRMGFRDYQESVVRVISPV